jgi:hypothetical protein
MDANTPNHELASRGNGRGMAERIESRVARHRRGDAMNAPNRRSNSARLQSGARINVLAGLTNRKKETIWA